MEDFNIYNSIYAGPIPHCVKKYILVIFHTAQIKARPQFCLV